MAPAQEAGHPPPRLAASDWDFRPYNHGEDYHKVAEMCADVYGGTDYLPGMMEHYSKQADTVYMLVAAHHQGGLLGGIVGCDLRGSAVFVFGLRVSTSLRGRGLAGLLMDAVIQHSRTKFPQAKAIFSATIPQNLASAVVLSKRLSAQPIQTLDHWPDWDITNEFERSFGWPHNEAGPSHCIIDAVNGAMELLKADTLAAAQVARWRPAESMQEVHDAVSTIKGVGGHEATRHPQLDIWLPGKYEVMPLDFATVTQSLSDGKLWVLTAGEEERSSSRSTQTPPTQGNGHAQATGGYLGVLLVYYSWERKRSVVSILAAQPSVVHSGLLAAAQRLLPHNPHFVSFIGRGPGCDAPALYQLSAPRTCLVFGRAIAE